MPSVPVELIDRAQLGPVLLLGPRQRLLLEQGDEPLLGDGRVPAPVLAVDAARQVDRLEHLGRERDHLALPQDEDAVAAQGVVETGQHPLLQRGVQIDEDIPAEQEVQPGDRRIGNEVVDAEHHRSPDLLPHRPAARLLHEPVLQRLLGEGLHLLPRVDAVAGIGHRLLVRVGPEHLHFLVLERGAHHLRQQDGDREGLLAGGTPRAPDPQVVPGALFGEKLGQHLARELLPHLLVAEEAGDLDQHRADQGPELRRLALEQGGVLRHGLAAPVRHAALDPASQGRTLVVAEVEIPRAADAFEDLLDRRLFRVGSIATVALRRHSGGCSSTPRREPGSSPG